jgi:hypothetical protein
MTTLMNQSELPGGNRFKICDLGALAVAWPSADQSGSRQLAAFVEQFIDLTTQRLATMRRIAGSSRSSESITSRSRMHGA